MKNNIQYFYDGLDKLQIALSEHQVEQFTKYFDMLIETNKVMNLTAITEPKEVIDKHFLDSLSLVKVVDFNNYSGAIIDVGTGAGFPGIPLKIAFPNINLTLLDSLNKRINFLNNVIEELGLEKVEAIHGRSEELGKNPNYREKYDVCVSRAVANLSTLSEYTLPFVKVGGQFISYKAGDCKEEVEGAKKAISLLGGNIKDIISFNLNDMDISRSFICIEKVKETSKRFPRKAGLPSKEPLK